MEFKQCTTDVLNLSPYSKQGFLVNKFEKKSSHLNIPDTIPENLSEDSLKMEVPEVAAEDLSSEDKENVNINLLVKCNESINNSSNSSIHNSYIKQCERKLLESSNSEDDKTIESDNGVVNKRLIDIQRKLVYHNDTLSTPPSLLRKEISLLRKEMAEAHEFHDFEIQVLKEEKLNEADSYNYLELFEKYSALTELYATLKTEYEEYRKEQEKIRQEYQSKTADCLEFLCSQIEASDNSLNFSNASFVSFKEGIKSSTMMEDVSEVEATVVHDATILVNDPLSITNEVVFKTPMQTPLKSAKKIEKAMNLTITSPVINEVKDVIIEHTTPVPHDSEYNIQLLHLETTLYDKVKEVEDLEQRLFKVEDLSTVLQNEFERITSVYAKENNILKESLAKKTEQLNELTEKLYMEIISLNPSLRDSLNDITGVRLLVVLIETIMESCRKIQNEEVTKHNAEKADLEAQKNSELMVIKDLQNQTSLHLAEIENFKKIRESLETKLHDAESMISNQDEEIKVLRSNLSALRETQEGFASVRETLSEVESRLTLTEAEKKAAENRYRELEAVVGNLEHEIEAQGKYRLELQTQLLTMEKEKSETESDNVRLRQLYDTLKNEMSEVESKLKSNEFEVTVLKENLTTADGTILQLKSQLQSIEVEKINLENQFRELQENNQQLLVEINNAKNLENILANEKALNENDNLKRRIFEKEEIIEKLKTELELAKEEQINSFRRVEELSKEIEDLKKENSSFSKTLDAVDQSQKNLIDLISDIKNDDIPGDRITKLIENSLKLQESTETRGTKIITIFIDTIMKTCKEVQNDLIKYYDDKKLQWEIQRDVDLNLITSLQDQIKCLTEKCIQHEAKISEINEEKENLIESFENLKTQMTKAEKIISDCNEEINVLKSQENILKQKNDDLAAADGIIIELKSQMTSVLTEKAEVESRCRKLEENVLNFQIEIETKHTITKELGEMQIIRERIENENSDLKQQILKSEGTILLLKKNLEEAKEEQSNRDIRIQNLQNEIDLLKNEQEGLMSLSKNLENLEKNNKNLLDILSDVQHHLDMPENTIAELLSSNFENKKIFSERINCFIKTQTEKQFLWQETKQMVFEDLKNKYEVLEKKLADAENLILAREEEIRTIQCELRQNQEDIAALKSQLALSECEKLEAEGRCHALDEDNKNLKLKVDASEKLQLEVQAHLLSLEEKRSEFENENVHLKELCDVLQVKLSKTEDIISKLEEEVRVLTLNQSSQLELEDLRKMYETLRTKFLATDRMNFSRTEEIQILQVEILNLRQIKEDLAEAKEVLSDKLKFIEIEKTNAENRCRELENVIENLKKEIEIKENCLTEFKTQKLEINMENVKLKELYDILKAQMTEAENVIFTRDEEIRHLKSYKSELLTVKEDLMSADETISQLKVQLKSVEVEKFEVENRCSELLKSNENLRVEITTAKNLESNPAYEKIQVENHDLKERIFESDKMMAELKNELERAKKDQMNNICKVEELIREIEELKKENIDFSHALTTIEETQKNLADVLLGHVEHDSDLNSDRLMELIAQNSKLSDSENKQSKIITDFVETLTKTCKGIQNEWIKKFDNKILEWENQKDVELQNFQDQIKLLTEKNVQCEASIKQTKDSLAAADDIILQLKSQLSLLETEKTQLKIQCQKLEEGILTLQAEIDTKETIIKGFDELKIVWKKIEKENGDLKQQTLESEEVIIRLKNCLEMRKEEQNRNEMKIQDLQNEIDLLKNERQDLMTLSRKLESVEKNNNTLINVFSDIQSCLNMPEDILTKLMSGDLENKKVFSEKINSFAKTQMEGLKAENKHLKFGIDNLKEKVKQLTKLICETANNDLKEALSNLNNSHPNSMSLRSKSKNMDICVRRLDKLEEINYNLTEMLTRILSMTEFPDLEKLKLSSVRDYSSIMKKLVAHFKNLESKMKELKEENAQLDEECETYANIIKDLKKEAAAVWKLNKEKTEAMEMEISRLNEEKNRLEEEKQDLLAKIYKFEVENQKLKSTSKPEEPFHHCDCGNESKKINELKRSILMKEQKLLELQDLETQTSSYKSQIEYLKNALEREKKKVGEEKEKNKKLQNELNESTKNQKTENKQADEIQMLDELRMRGSISGGVVQEFVDKEKMRKLTKDIGILKELCRARYAEIKRLEAANAALRNGAPKNSNQMDSPLRSRGYNTRSKNQTKNLWRAEISGKENGALL